MTEENFKKLGRRLGDLSDLPEELRAELQITKTDELENQIIEVINESYEGMANIDEVIVGIYRKYNDIQKRQFLANKMYRMAKTGLLYSVKGRKGVYTTKEELESYYTSKKN